jgi:hypothetical protein
VACDRSSSGHDGHDADRPWPPAVLTDSSGWQMSFGERAALEGLLAACRPGLAIEIGTAEGGSLSALAAHSDEVHAIDLAEPELEPAANVEVHVGDSKAVLPALLERLASGGRNVDYVLVDGDHSAAGVRADLENLLRSPAVAETLIVCHDPMNEKVRGGIESVDFAAHPKVRYVELDFVAGYMGRQDPFEGQLWGGLGIVVVDAASDPGIPGGIDGDPRYYDAHTMLRKRGGTRPLHALLRLLASRRGSG